MPESSNDIIGEIIKSKWEVVNQEILAICNLFRNLTRKSLGERECE